MPNLRTNSQCSYSIQRQGRTYHVPIAYKARKIRRIDDQEVEAGECEQVTRGRGSIAIEVSRAARGARRDRGLAIGLSRIEQLAGLFSSQ